MRRGAQSFGVAATLLAAAVSTGACHRETPPDHPASAPPLSGAADGWNVVVLSLDTLRADRLNAYGYAERETSPALDRLLAGGVRFERAMAPRSITWPSLASVLTGLYPTSHGVVQNGYELPSGLATLPLTLRAAGYQTGAFLSNMCRAGHDGWDRFFCSRGSDGKANAAALEWTAELEGERPFLLWLHYFAAHPPYYNGGELAIELDPGYEGPVQPKKGRLDAVMRQQIELDEADRRHLDAIYDASVIGSDRTVAALLDELERRGLLERTLVVLLSDHGEDLYDHNEYLYHACSVYQTTLHVPLGFVAPDLLPAGRTVAAQVELVDVLPTTLDLLGIAPPQAMDGRSLVPYFALEQRIRPRPAFSEYTGAPIRTVLDYPWSLVENPGGETPICFADAPPDLYPIAELELYDLSRDPLESQNLAADHPAEVERLRALIERRFAALVDRSEEQELPEELKRQLEALGYVAN